MKKIQDRKVQVLKYIVEEYLKTGEIMGSKNLLKKYDLQVSSATVRNDMASLEDMGLIFQQTLSAKQEQNRIDDVLYGLVSRLTKTTGEITFACIPSLGTSYYLGLSNYLERHHGSLGEEMYQVIKCLENKHQFIDYLQSLDITSRVSAFI